MVLQGDGVTIDLVGATFISKSGITSTTFKTVPDQPFSTFELTLPEGKYSALAANGNLYAPTTTSEQVRIEYASGRERSRWRWDYRWWDVGYPGERSRAGPVTDY
jgi:hypothetical protein